MAEAFGPGPKREEFARQQREADELHAAVLEFRRTSERKRAWRIEANRARVEMAQTMTLRARTQAPTRRTDERAQPRTRLAGARARARSPGRPRGSEDSESDRARRP